jgi:hypothetical protein
MGKPKVKFRVGQLVYCRLCGRIAKIRYYNEYNGMYMLSCVSVSVDENQFRRLTAKEARR